MVQWRENLVSLYPAQVLHKQVTHERGLTVSWNPTARYSDAKKTVHSIVQSEKSELFLVLIPFWAFIKVKDTNTADSNVRSKHCTNSKYLRLAIW